MTKLKEAGIEHVSITADRTYGDHAISRKEQVSRLLSRLSSQILTIARLVFIPHVVDLRRTERGGRKRLGGGW